MHSLQSIVLFLQDMGLYLFLFIGLPMALYAAGHAILNKKEVRASIGWVAVISLVPVAGAILYFLLGINRIQRKASRLLGSRQRMAATIQAQAITEEELEAYLPDGSEHMLAVNRLVGTVTEKPLLPGNCIRPLLNGDNAYPEMLEAIQNAKHTIGMVSYIFDADEVGHTFREALREAVQRGVEVRVLIDAVGARYSWPPFDNQLRADGIQAVRFMPTRVPWRAPYMNLRNHRKILVVDGHIGFTGGMNIRVGHDLSRNPSHPVQDLHFRVEGPVVAHLQETFAEDWVFSTGEVLEGEHWFPALQHEGDSYARGIKEGPDEDFEKLRWSLLAAIGSARRSIRIVSPYFLPDVSLATALNLAALRGVHVEIVIPKKNNLRLVQWAMNAHLPFLLSNGCKIYASTGPFDHTKLVLIDRAWGLFGSANWDPRSFRLNFEFNVETYDSVLVESLDDFVTQKIERSHLISLKDIHERPLPIRLRDGLARLLTPYL